MSTATEKLTRYCAKLAEYRTLAKEKAHGLTLDQIGAEYRRCNVTPGAFTDLVEQYTREMARKDGLGL